MRLIFLLCIFGISFSFFGAAIADPGPIIPKEMFEDESPLEISNNPAEKISNECEQSLLEFQEYAQQHLGRNAVELDAFRKRALKDPKITRKVLDKKILYLIQNFDMVDHRIRNAPIFDGANLADDFIRGVIIWAKNYQELHRAIEVFYHEDTSAFATDPSAMLEDDLDLQYFAARMLYIVYSHDKLYNGPASAEARRLFALSMAARFDATTGDDLHFYFDPQILTVVRSRLDPQTLVDLTFLGFHLPSEALSNYLGLQFNNELRFNPDKTTIAEKWVGIQLSEYFPHERLLGLGDESTRLFFHLFRVDSDGTINKLPKAADYLFLTPEKPTDLEDYKDHNGPKALDSIKWSLVIRELKLMNPNDAPIVREGEYIPKVEDAVTQLLSTWKGLYTIHGDSLPVSKMELVIPKKKNGSKDLGDGYSIGSAVEWDNTNGWVRSQLLRDGNPIVHETALGKWIGLTVLEIPIADDKLRRMRTRK